MMGGSFGKGFAQGAQTAAIAYLANHVLHQTIDKLLKFNGMYKQAESSESEALQMAAAAGDKRKTDLSLTGQMPLEKQADGTYKTTCPQTATACTFQGVRNKGETPGRLILKPGESAYRVPQTVKGASSGD
jgi:hypothetical protein